MLQFLGVSLSGLSTRAHVPKNIKTRCAGELTEETQRSTTTNTHPNKCSPIVSDNELKCVCLNARSIVNKNDSYC